MPVSQYIYRPLDKLIQQYRLILLKPRGNRKRSLVQCELLTVELEQNRARRAYKALSYCWGDPKATYPIKVDGYVHYVSQSLGTFLERQRDESSSYQYLWADGLCINQSDIREKEQQITLMTQIYSNAAGLLIWLGDESSHTKGGLGLISEFDEFYDSDIRARTLAEDEIELFRETMSASWFDRTWIIQELVLGMPPSSTATSEAILGRERVSWQKLSRSIHRLQNHNKRLRQQFPSLDRFQALEDLRNSYHASTLDTRPSALWWVSSTRHRGCTDPRDRIYSLLGLIDRPSPGLADIDPDYSISAKTLYTRFAINLIQSTPGLEVLRHCQYQSDYDIPSWVPNWAHPMVVSPLWNPLLDTEPDGFGKGTCFVYEETNFAMILRQEAVPLSHYQVAADTPAHLSINMEQNSLQVKGIYFGKVKQKSDPFISSVSSNMCEPTIFMIQVDLIREIVEKLPQESNPYLSEKGRLEALWRAILADHDGMGGYRPLLHCQDYLPPIPESWNPDIDHIQAPVFGEYRKVQYQSAVLRQEFAYYLKENKGECNGYKWEDFAPIKNVPDLETAGGSLLKDFSEYSHHEHVFRNLIESKPDLTPEDARRYCEITVDTKNFRRTGASMVEAQRERRKTLLENAAIASLWQHGERDLKMNPFSFPFTIPDPFAYERKEPEFEFRSRRGGP